MEPLLKGEGQAVVSVTAPGAVGLPAVLAWGDLASGQQYNPEACCQKASLIYSSTSTAPICMQMLICFVSPSLRTCD